VQQTKPIIVHLVPAPTRETTWGDVLLGSIGLTVVLMVLSLVLAGLFALLLVRRNRRHPPELDRLPPVSPFAPGSDVPPSSPVR
jgi:hypothetical protein